ncbi:MAG: helix-turn-helix domain-containing protein, partial [Gemmobacter sp.]
MAKASGDLALPDWLPEAARFYLEHTAAGVSLRNLARRAGCHPSTVLRHVRRFETRRDDPLIDAALDALTRDPDIHARGANPMTAPFRPDLSTSSGPDSPRRIDEATLAREARRILRRLIEPGALLVLGAEF